MLKHYLVTACRNLLRQKLYAGINIVGLAIGMAYSVLILLYIQDELRYDAFHQRADRIYRVALEWQFDDDSTIYSAFTSGLLAPALLERVPGVERAVRLSQARYFLGSPYVERGEVGPG